MLVNTITATVETRTNTVETRSKNTVVYSRIVKIPSSIVVKVNPSVSFNVDSITVASQGQCDSPSLGKHIFEL